MDVAGNNTEVLDVHPLDELAEHAQLGRAVEAAPQRVREIEVATEGGRRHPLGEESDLSRREQTLEAEGDAVFGRYWAQRREGVGAASEAGLAFNLATHEERDEDDPGAELRSPGNRRSDVLECGRRHLTVRVCDPAVVVLAEHESVDLQLAGLGRARVWTRVRPSAAPPAEGTARRR